MPTKFYFKIQYFNSDKLQSHFFTVTDTLNGEKSDSNQCYSESESATAHCTHSTAVSTQFTTWMFSSLITKFGGRKMRRIGCVVSQTTAGAETRRVHHARGAGGGACNAPLPSFTLQTTTAKCRTKMVATVVQIGNTSLVFHNQCFCYISQA